MAWNEPGNSGNGRNPWGNKGGSNQGPPDLDEVVRNLRDKFGGLFGGRGGRGAKSDGAGTKGTIMLVILLALGWLLYSASYIIDEKERGVVLRFGKYVDTLQPGFSLRFPRPIEEVIVVDITVRALQIGINRDESYMLTQDQNIIDIQFDVQYRVKNAADYIFKNFSPEDSLKQATESAVRETVGKNIMDFVIKDGRQAVGDQAGQLVQKIVDSYGTGIEITQFNMQKAKEPEEVRDAFADAVKAEADEERYKNVAETYRQEVLGKGRGQAQRLLQDSEGYRSRVVESSNGEAARFTKLLAEYEKAPEVTRERLYIEAMETVLSNSTKIMTDTGGGNNNLLYLPLDQLIRQRNISSTQQDIWTPEFDAGQSQSGSSAVQDDPRRRGGR